MTEEKETKHKAEIAIIEEKTQRLNEAAERLETAQKKAEADRVEKMLGGQAEAGAEPVRKGPETPEQYRDRILRGEL